MKNIFLIILIAFIAASCKKEGKETLTIKGQMLSCIDGVEKPYLTNTAIDLFQQKDGSNNKSKVLANTVIDANGNFIFTYNTTNSFDKLMIRASSGFGFGRIITEIPVQSISNLKIYFAATYNLVVSLNALKPYTSSDTLYILRPDTFPITIVKIPGPFINKRVFKVGRLPALPEMIYGKNEGIQNAYLNTNIDLSKSYVIENSKLCGDTVYVNIDVK